MRILLTGATGQVGRTLLPILTKDHDVIAPGRDVLDLGKSGAVRNVMRDVKPEVVINSGAWTAVDLAESRETEATAVNAGAVAILGEEAKNTGARIIHFSTDYVFDGEKQGPYAETDTPNPMSAYGRGKLAGEQALVASGANYVILRLSWVYATEGQNFAKTILRLAQERDTLSIVADQIGAPTPASLAAEVTCLLLTRKDVSGIFHLSPAGATSWHGYAQFLLTEAQKRGMAFKTGPEALVAIPSADYKQAARRPKNSILDTALLRQALGIKLPDWRQGVVSLLDLIAAGNNNAL